MLCTRCQERRPEPNKVWCRRCIELSTVYTHQLHKRRGWAEKFLRHTCSLCRKWKAFVRTLIERWDARQEWVTRTCSEGHVWTKGGGQHVCPKCSYKAGQEYLKSIGYLHNLPTVR